MLHGVGRVHLQPLLESPLVTHVSAIFILVAKILDRIPWTMQQELGEEVGFWIPVRVQCFQTNNCRFLASAASLVDTGHEIEERELGSHDLRWLHVAVERQADDLILILPALFQVCAKRRWHAALLVASSDASLFEQVLAESRVTDSESELLLFSRLGGWQILCEELLEHR